MPVCGVRSNNGLKLHFSWRSVRVFWSMLYLAATAALGLLYAMRLCETGVNTGNLGVQDILARERYNNTYLM